MEKFRDLRDWLDKVREMGELKTITEEVDWDEETGRHHLHGGEGEGRSGAPFRKREGVSQRVQDAQQYFGIQQSADALTLGLPLDLPTIELIRRTKDFYNTRIPPQVVDKKEAPVNENILTEKNINLFLFPAAKMWPLDGAGTSVLRT